MPTGLANASQPDDHCQQAVASDTPMVQYRFDDAGLLVDSLSTPPSPRQGSLTELVTITGDTNFTYSYDQAGRLTDVTRGFQIGERV
jgi:YD repeat-containing protein